MLTWGEANADPAMQPGGWEWASADRSLGAARSSWIPAIVGSDACRPFEIIKNTMKMVQFYTNFHYRPTWGCKAACTCIPRK